MSSDSGGGAAAPMPPDIHFKMCKKIAQLTKVIYHLNIRNEDHDADVAALAASHKEQLAAASATAQEAVSKLTAAFGASKAALEASVAELTAALDREKDAASEALAAREKQHKCVIVML